MRINFDDDFFSLFRNSLGHGRTKAKVKITVFVHRRYGNHRHIDINDIAVNRRFITETHRIKKHARLCCQFAVISAEMPVHNGKSIAIRVAFAYLAGKQGHGFPYFNIM